MTSAEQYIACSALQYKVYYKVYYSALLGCSNMYIVKYRRVQYSDIAVQWNMWKCTVHSAGRECYDQC